MKNIREELTVIIPAYNCDKTIKKCVGSITSFDKKIKIIIINDGSTDSTYDICNKLAANNKNIRIISTENFGVSHARNVGIDACVTDYLIFLDSDDMLVLNNLKSTLENFDESIDVLKFSFIMKNKKEKKIIFRSSIYDLSNDYDKFITNFFESSNYNMIWGQIIKKSVLTENGIKFSEELTFSEDILFNYNLYRCCKRIAFSDMIGYLYIDNNCSLTRSKKIELSKRRIFDGLKAFEQMIKIEDASYHDIIRNKSLHEIFPQILSLKIYIKKYQDMLPIYNEIYADENFCKIFNKFDSKKYRNKYKIVIYNFIHRKTYFVYIYSKYIYIHIKRIKFYFVRKGFI